jgi:hypothetical protein
MSEDPFHPERGERSWVGRELERGRQGSLLLLAKAKREAPESAAVIRRIGRDGCSYALLITDRHTLTAVWGNRSGATSIEYTVVGAARCKACPTRIPRHREF